MNSTINNTNQSQSSASAFFISIAAMALLTNVFILFVFIFNRELRASSALLIGLTTSHTLNGAIHLVHGLDFLWPPRQVPPFYCIITVDPIVFIAIYQLLPVFLALNGIERLLAMGLPTWYWVNCKNKQLWKVTGITFLYSLFCMVTTIIKTFYNTTPTISSYCSPPQMLGPFYIAYLVHLPAILGGICAGVCSAVAVYIGRRRIAEMPANSESEIKRVQKHLRITKCILLISIFDFLFVVIPNIIFLILNLGLWPYGLTTTFTGILATVYCSDSIWNLFAFILFNGEFRETCMKIFRCGKAPAPPVSSLTTQKPGRNARLAWQDSPESR